MTLVPAAGGPSPSAVILPGFAGPELPVWLSHRLRGGLAGVCLFGTNIVSKAQLAELTGAIREANPHAVIAIDEEGGDVTRLHYDTGAPYPGNAVLGRLDDVRYTESVARAVGNELAAVGVNLNLAPDVDINSDPDNPVIGVRSFGADPALVARHSAAWVRGLQSTGVAACAKHFPGHGDTAEDSHLALPVVDVSLDVLEERELVPFAAAIDAGSAAIMSSHIVLPQLDRAVPATFSSGILNGLMRDELGFTGAVVSDALDMAGASGELGIATAALRALEAGCDLLCLGTDNTHEQLDEIEAALQAANPSRLAEATRRVRALATGSLPATGGRAPEPSFDLDRTIGAFDVKAGAVAPAGATLVSFETTVNIAIGTAPWGPAAAGAQVVSVREPDPLPDSDGLILIGKDNHRHEWVRRKIDLARKRNSKVLVVDMGWPAPDRAYADVATFGASRHVGQALLRWLEGSAR